VGVLKRRRRGRPPMGSGPADVVPVSIDSELLAAIEARAETEHANTSEIIRRFLDVAWLITISQSETNTSKPANGSQTSEGPAAHLDMNPLRHKGLCGTPGVTRTPNLLIRSHRQGSRSIAVVDLGSRYLRPRHPIDSAIKEIIEPDPVDEVKANPTGRVDRVVSRPE
jgi:hypothetical protein